MKAGIDTRNSCLSLKQLFKKTIDTSWASITAVTLTRLPSLANEIGMIAYAGEHEFHLHETDEGFRELVKALGIEAGLPTSWYADVEAGETLTIDL